MKQRQRPYDNTRDYCRLMPCDALPILADDESEATTEDRLTDRHGGPATITNISKDRLGIRLLGENHLGQGTDMVSYDSKTRKYTVYVNTRDLYGKSRFGNFQGKTCATLFPSQGAGADQAEEVEIEGVEEL